MDLFTLGAIAEKINAEMDLGNKEVEIVTKMTPGMVDDAYLEIQSAIATLASALLSVFRQTQDTVSVQIGEDHFRIGKEIYKKLQDIKEKDESDEACLLRLVDKEFGKIAA